MRRRALLMAQSHSGSSGGMDVTLYEGENGQTGIDVYNYIISNGIDTEVGNEDKDWYATEQDNILITGSLATNQRVESAFCAKNPYGDDYVIYLWYTGIGRSYEITLNEFGILFMDDGD